MPYIDAEPSRLQLQRLRAAGLGVNQIVAVSGVASGTVRQLIYGGPGPDNALARIRPSTAVRLLAVSPRDVAAGARVDAAPTRRRLQALVAAGWSIPILADYLERRPRSLNATLVRDHVTGATARNVRGVYALLELLSAIDDPLAQQHAAIIRLARRGDPTTAITIAADTDIAGQAVFDALDAADLDTLTDIVMASPELREESVGQLGLAILLAQVGEIESAADLAAAAHEAAAANQRRAWTIHLGRLRSRLHADSSSQIDLTSLDHVTEIATADPAE